MAENLSNINNFLNNSRAIKNYNNYISDNFQKNFAQESQKEGQNFEDIFNQQMDNFSNQFQAGIEMNINSDSMRIEGIEQTNQSSSDSVGDMINSFKNAVGNGLNAVNEKAKASQTAIETFASGGDIDVHEVMIASQKSSLSMQMAMQLRNKMLSFYNEINQVRV